VRLAWNIAEGGEVILLSPACSSFDMFHDYEDRGRTFKEIVRRVAGDAR
jgi:UDP-N-acetylmuramoylalanine--D-glutamate ligase